MREEGEAKREGVGACTQFHVHKLCIMNIIELCCGVV